MDTEIEYRNEVDIDYVMEAPAEGGRWRIVFKEFGYRERHWYRF